MRLRISWCSGYDGCCGYVRSRSILRKCTMISRRLKKHSQRRARLKAYPCTGENIPSYLARCSTVEAAQGHLPTEQQGPRGPMTELPGAESTVLKGGEGDRSLTLHTISVVLKPALLWPLPSVAVCAHEACEPGCCPVAALLLLPGTGFLPS